MQQKRCTASRRTVDDSESMFPHQLTGETFHILTIQLEYLTFRILSCVPILTSDLEANFCREDFTVKLILKMVVELFEMTTAKRERK